MTVEQLRSWLLQQPRPASVRCTVDGEARVLHIGNQTWKGVAMSCLALQPDLVEALDSQGGVLRATRPSDDLEEDDSPDGTASSHSAVSAAPSGGYSEATEETRRFEIYARGMSEAYRHANEIAFARMVDLFEAVNARAQSQEKQMDHLWKLLRRAEEERLDAEQEAAEQAQAAATNPEGMLGAVIAHAVQNGAANGATKGSG